MDCSYFYISFYISCLLKFISNKPHKASLASIKPKHPWKVDNTWRIINPFHWPFYRKFNWFYFYGLVLHLIHRKCRKCDVSMCKKSHPYIFHCITGPKLESGAPNEIKALLERNLSCEDTSHKDQKCSSRCSEKQLLMPTSPGRVSKPSICRQSL